MSWVAVAIGGSALIGAAGGAIASGDAADQMDRAGDRAIAEERRQFDTIAGLQQPAMVTGTGALNRLARLQGLPYQEYQAPQLTGPGGSRFAEGGTKYRPGQVLKLIKQGFTVDEINEMGYLGGRLKPGKVKKLTKRGITLDQIKDLQTIGPDAQNAAAEAEIITPDGPDMSEFFESPDYQFNRGETLSAVDRTAASRSGALSGNAVRASEEVASGLASQEYGNFFERLMRIAGLGGSATNTVSSAAANTGGNVAQIMMGQGQARASGLLGTANSVGDALNTGLNAWLLNRGGYFGGRT